MARWDTGNEHRKEATDHPLCLCLCSSLPVPTLHLFLACRPVLSRPITSRSELLTWAPSPLQPSGRGSGGQSGHLSGKKTLKGFCGTGKEPTKRNSRMQVRGLSSSSCSRARGHGSSAYRNCQPIQVQLPPTAHLKSQVSRPASERGQERGGGNHRQRRKKKNHGAVSASRREQARRPRRGGE